MMKIYSKNLISSIQNVINSAKFKMKTFHEYDFCEILESTGIRIRFYINEKLNKRECMLIIHNTDITSKYISDWRTSAPGKFCMKDYKKVVEIPVEKIKIISKDVRLLDDERMKSFQVSLQKRERIIPFIVTKIGDDYILDNCFNRFTAMKLAGYKTLPCRLISERERERRIKFKRRFYARYVI